MGGAMVEGAEVAGKGPQEGLPLMSKLIAVRPTRKASNTGGKFSEKAWERAARTWTRQKTIWGRGGGGMALEGRRGREQIAVE